MISSKRQLVSFATTKVVVFHDKSKHIEIKYHYIRDMAQRGAMKLQYVATDEKKIDVLMKLLVRVMFEYFIKRLGVIQIKVHIKRE